MKMSMRSVKFGFSLNEDCFLLYCKRKIFSLPDLSEDPNGLQRLVLVGVTSCVLLKDNRGMLKVRVESSGDLRQIYCFVHPGQSLLL